MDLKQELIEKYNATGKIGFTKPKNREEAYQIIETLTQAYADTQPKEEVVYNLSEITEKLRNFFNNF